MGSPHFSQRALPPLWAAKIFVRVLHMITFRLVTIEKDQARE
jgi:hypothetical protein